jgi:periplasmic protein TonB
MPREMFGDIARPPAGLGSQSRYTVPLSMVAHAVVAIGIVIVPLVATDTVPILHTSVPMAVAAAPLPPDPPPLAPKADPRGGARAASPNVAAAPRDAPNQIAEELPGPTGPPNLSLIPSEGAANLSGVFGGVSEVLSLPAAPAPRVATPLRAGGNVKYPEKVHDVRPLYPQLALAARVQGLVLIEAVIGVDGRVRDAHVIRSVPLLDAAALDAVRQWRFTPTLLNGEPVPVIMTINVNFKLN